jgi:beta-1,4-mannooligosaccharide phosphorylase
LGVRADKQLRLTHRTGRRPAVVDAWRRASAEIFHRSGSSRQHDSKVLPRAREPLVRPEPTEREGYVPNVVYTCGALRHGDRIILPCAVSDTFSNFSTINTAVLSRLLRANCASIEWLSDVACSIAALHHGPPAVSLPWRTRRNPVCATGLETSHRTAPGSGVMLARSHARISLPLSGPHAATT